MKGIDFFNKLIDECKAIPESKLDKIIFYYKEQINIGKENGHSESEIIKGFGNIDELIHKIIDNPDLFIEKNIPKNNIYFNNNDISEKITLYSKSDTSNNNINDITFDKKNHLNKIDILLKIVIGILSFTILFPLTTTIIGFILGFLAIFICLFFFCIFLLFNINTLENLSMIPDFILDLPKESLACFSIGSICLSLFVIIGTIFICKTLYLNLKHFYVYAKQREVNNE